MAGLLERLPDWIRSDVGPGRVVPPAGFTMRLTLFTAGAMGFLAVFALALALAAGNLATSWAEALASTATVRISAPPSEVEGLAASALEILRTTPGVAEARRLSDAEERALLEPWLGADLPLDALPLPALIEVIEGAPGIDAEGLQARLTGEAPGAVFDDHARWRAPLVDAAMRLRLLGYAALALIAAATAAMVALAAQAALAANARVIETLRLVGAQDSWIARAFVRRFTLRAAAGAAIGAALASLTLSLSPPAETSVLPVGMRFRGTGWLWPLAVPLLAGAAAFGATRLAAFRQLKETR